MDLKLNNLSVDLLGLRLTLKVPTIPSKEQDNKSEEEKKDECTCEKENISNEKEDSKKKSYLEWRYGELPKPQRATIKELAKLEHATMKNNMRPQVLSEKESLLKYDQRVVNRLLTVEQLNNIEKWLSDQPEKFPTETEYAKHLAGPSTDIIDGNMIDVIDGYLDEVTKATNYYRDIANSKYKRRVYSKESLV